MPTAAALAQDVTIEETAEEATEGTLTDEMPTSSQAAAMAWVEAWQGKPKLVTLKKNEATGDVKEALENRLKQLGEKGFSNREWRDYWQKQVETAQAFVDALSDPAFDSARKAALTDWVNLAKKKVGNQETYFEAIQTESDAVEHRLESLLEPGDSASGTNVASPEDHNADEVNPYERLRLHKSDLMYRIEVQKGKKRMIDAERLFIERQLATEKTLATALGIDFALAQSELSISSGQSSEMSGWGRFWSGVSMGAVQKVDKIGGEVEYVQMRKRAREVELGLGQSQVEFRQTRIEELGKKLTAVSGFSSLALAAWETLYQWLLRESWKVFGSLVLLYFAVRFARRLLNRGVKVVLKRTDDNDEVDDDGDQRRETLADVFLSVARIAIYVVAGLIALEQIGVNTGPILGSVAILGLAISFGSQNLVRDIVNGFFILLENQYAVADVVTINGKTGSVEKISIRSTWIRQATGDLHVIPNGAITVVSNLTRGWSKATCEIGVSYSADLEHVKEVVTATGAAMYADEAWSEQLAEAPQWIGVTELGDSSVVVRTQVKVSPGSQWGVTREMNLRLKVAFDKAGIEIPYPHQVVHHVNAP